MPYLTIERKHAATTRIEIDRSTRQDPHPLTGLVRPPAPSAAKYHIEIWEPSLCNWGHYGFARNEAERSRLLESIRAFSHRGRATRLSGAGESASASTAAARRRRVVRW
jgi:hypothetical protein